MIITDLKQLIGKRVSSIDVFTRETIYTGIVMWGHTQDGRTTSIDILRDDGHVGSGKDGTWACTLKRKDEKHLSGDWYNPISQLYLEDGEEIIYLPDGTPDYLEETIRYQRPTINYKQLFNEAT